MNAKLKTALLVGAALALFVLARRFDAAASMKEALGWIQGQGAFGAGVFVLIYIAACVALLPGSILTLGAGAVWGVVWGTLVVSIASVSGATAAFLIARYAARDWAKGLIAGDPRFAAMDRALEREGLRLVFLIRLSPAFPFNLLNYAFGLSPVRLRDHLLGSWAGMLPGTVMYVYLGALAGDAAAGGAAAGGPPLWFKALGLAVTVGVVLYVVRLARNALNQELSP